jgi:hypothetical protein
MMVDHWTLVEALDLIRGLQPQTRKYGYHLCLGGGVLNKGESKKDLDLFFLPLDNGGMGDPTGLVKWIDELWGKGEDLWIHYPGQAAESSYRAKLKYNYSGLRVDVFVI